MRASLMKSIHQLTNLESINEQLFEMMKLFYNHYPCDIIQIYQYSTLNQTYSGLLSYEHPSIQSLKYINNIQIDNYFHHELLRNEVLFLNNDQLQLSIQNQYLFSKPIKNMFLIPFSTNNVIIGFMTGVNPQFEVTDNILKEIDEFNRQCMYSLNYSKFKVSDNSLLTEKEVTIMQYFSNGYTTKEMSYLFSISESTIKYFLKNVMKKTNSKNRTQAVAKLIHLNIIN